MLRSVFAVYDSVSAELFGPLFIQPNEASARRLFQDALFGQGSALASHPQDFDLYYLGALDTETGAFSQPSATPFLDRPPVVTGAEVVRLVRSQQQREDSAQVDLVDELVGAVNHG